MIERKEITCRISEGVKEMIERNWIDERGGRYEAREEKELRQERREAGRQAEEQSG